MTWLIRNKNVFITFSLQTCNETDSPVRVVKFFLNEAPESVCTTGQSHAMKQKWNGHLSYVRVFSVQQFPQAENNKKNLSNFVKSKNPRNNINYDLELAF